MVALARHCGLPVHVIDPLGEDTIELPPLSAVASPSEIGPGSVDDGNRIAAGMFLLFPSSSTGQSEDLAIPAERFPGEFHRVALDSQFRFYFGSAISAVFAMTRLRHEIVPILGEFAIALTAGPVTVRSMPSVSRDDVRGTMVTQGSSLVVRALEPPLVLATGEFVALAATEGMGLEGFEYNGRLSSPEGSYALFRCVREQMSIPGAG